MQDHDTIFQKPSLQNRSAERDRDTNGRFISSEVKTLNDNSSEGKLETNQSYNGGSTYGDHQSVSH